MKQTVSLKARRSLNQALLRALSANLFPIGIIASLAGFFLSVSGYDRTGASLSLIGLAALLLTSSNQEGGEK